MGLLSLIFTLFTIGYILGVWTACMVFRQPQRSFEDGMPAIGLVLARAVTVEQIRL